MTTIRLPTAVMPPTVTDTVRAEPSLLVLKPEMVMLESSTPSTVKNEMDVAPAKLAPLTVRVTVAPLVKVPGEMLDM